MNSIFLRIYGGMCAALVLVAVLGVLALHLLNQTRSEQYRERLAHGTFSLMADNLRPMNDTERRRALLVWERLLGIPLALQTFPQTDLDLGQRTRVMRGQALVEQTGPHAAKVYRLINDAEQLMLVGKSSRSANNWLARPFTCWPTSWCVIRWPNSPNGWRNWRRKKVLVSICDS